LKDKRTTTTTTTTTKDEEGKKVVWLACDPSRIFGYLGLAALIVCVST
jgi:hypothetical protein